MLCNEIALRHTFENSRFQNSNHKKKHIQQNNHTPKRIPIPALES